MRRLVLLSLSLIAGAASVSAQSFDPTGTWTFTNFGLYTYWLYGLMPSGASADILFDGLSLLPGLSTIVESDLGAGWQTITFYRNPDGSPYTIRNESPYQLGFAFQMAF